MSILVKAWWLVKGTFGFGNVYDGSICWFSNRYYDIHDYPVPKGGDGHPEHFIKYTCHKCGKEFGI